MTTANGAANTLLKEEDGNFAEANAELNILKERVEALTEELDAPNTGYQKYGEALRA